VAEVGIVAIGRNEGDRLKGCLQSALRAATAVVYVDSGSSDRSVETARELGVCVVELGASLPLGPSRARNAGVRRLLQLDPTVKFIQFVDGDCELAEQWIEVGERQLQSRSDVAIVCGRLRERFPSASVYNRLCDIEWDQPAGETLTSGGNCMARVDAFQQVGGFDENVIAGEEPELCFRLREKGWKILRVGAEMALHDSAMTRFGQWWRRAVRCGHAYAQGARMHGGSPERHYVRETRRAWAWGFLIPALAVSAAWPSGGISLLLFLLYPGQLWRIYRQARRRPLAPANAAAYAVSCVVSKFAEIFGVWKFNIRQILRTPMQLIEHR
jgi:GT2 family glycosyltransferase